LTAWSSRRFGGAEQNIYVLLYIMVGWISDMFGGGEEGVRTKL